MKFLSQFILFLALILILSTFITAEMNVEIENGENGGRFRRWGHWGHHGGGGHHWGWGRR
uniref:Uncharacterized protein n=1 Tax=Meloidogyne enterolobii TaxID=390850 RepID=A0A6V7WVI2_MELEN|nr:unnamed protein product [Meloidogyne enterolobii]